GHYFHENSSKDILIVSIVLLLAMGMLNSSVNNFSEGNIKTSHLTGLFTDLGAEISEWLHPKTPATSQLVRRIQLRLTILISYIAGALLGGWLFTRIRFSTFYIIAVFLLILLAYDFSIIRFNQQQNGSREV